jgi:hypothetical protein
VVSDESYGSDVDADLKFAVCIAGERSSLPEDVGGPRRYADFLDAIEYPRDVRHRECLEWVGGSFDPAIFDLVAVNAALQKVR